METQAHALGEPKGRRDRLRGETDIHLKEVDIDALSDDALALFERYITVAAKVEAAPMSETLAGEIDTLSREFHAVREVLRTQNKVADPGANFEGFLANKIAVLDLQVQRWKRFGNKPPQRVAA